MISKELRRKIFLKFDIEESNINRPIHYKIPDNTGKNSYLIYNTVDEQRLNKKISKITKNKTNYEKNTENNIRQIKKNIKKSKIDILFNKTYDKIFNKIDINSNYLMQKRIFVEMSSFSKEKMKDDLENKNIFINNTLFKKKFYRNNNNYFFNKQYNWSKTLLEQKKIKNYKKIYKIKYIDTLPSITKKIYENHKYQRDKTIPKIIKLNSTINSKKRNILNLKRKIILNQKYSIDKNKIKYNSIINYSNNSGDISQIHNNIKNIRII